MKCYVSFGLLLRYQLIIYFNLSVYRIYFHTLGCHFSPIHLNSATCDQLFARAAARYPTIGHEFLQAYFFGHLSSLGHAGSVTSLLSTPLVTQSLHQDHRYWARMEPALGDLLPGLDLSVLGNNALFGTKLPRFHAQFRTLPRVHG